MLTDKVKLSLTHEMATALMTLIADTIAGMDNFDRKDRIKIMVVASLKEVHSKLHAKTYNYKEKYNISLSLSQAQAIWVAYEKGYLYAKPGRTYPELILSNVCNKIHQLTA